MSFISTIVEWHENLFKNRLFTQKVALLTVTLAIILGIVAAYMNFQARQINWQLWEQNKEEFFYKDTPLFTTMDAGYFLGIAGYLKSGKTMDEYQSLRVFPKNQINEKQKDSPKLSVPASALLAGPAYPCPTVEYGCDGQVASGRTRARLAGWWISSYSRYGTRGSGLLG